MDTTRLGATQAIADAMAPGARALERRAAQTEKTPTGEDAEGIREAARQFESVFMHQVFKTMRATVPQNDMNGGGFGGQVFTDMLDQEYATLASATGQLGLADIIAEQLGAPARAATPRAPRIQAARAYRSMQPAPAPASDPNAWLRPVDGRRSSPFGPRQLRGEDHARMHHGLDIAAPTGTPIRASRAGEVTFAGRRGGYGNTVVLDHGDGTESLYAHASAIDVELGARVRAGETIAKVGSTGRSTGPHLHFEVRRDGEPIDPAELLANHAHADRIAASK